MITLSATNLYGTFTIKLVTCTGADNDKQYFKKSILLSRSVMYADCADMKRAWIDVNPRLAATMDIEYEFTARVKL